MADKLPAARFYALVAVIALFGLAPVLQAPLPGGNPQGGGR